MTQKTLSLSDLGDLTLLNDEGNPLPLGSLVGKRVLMFFFPKADTPGCTTQACGFRDAFPKIEAAGATVIGVSPDEPSALAKWKKKQNLPYTLLSDPDHVLADRIGAWGEKSMYGKTYLGIIRSHVVFNERGEADAVELKISPEDSINKGVKVLLGG